MMRHALMLLIPIVGLAACSRQQSAPAKATQPPAVASGGPAQAAAPAGDMASQTVTGPVLETIDAASYTNDITVTTAEDVAVSLGDTIIVTGTVVLDKNLGEGYAYAIVIEDARVVETTKRKAGT